MLVMLNPAFVQSLNLLQCHWLEVKLAMTKFARSKEDRWHDFAELLVINCH
jgi:hypothetical protein